MDARTLTCGVRGPEQRENERRLLENRRRFRHQTNPHETNIAQRVTGPGQASHCRGSVEPLSRPRSKVSTSTLVETPLDATARPGLASPNCGVLSTPTAKTAGRRA